MRTSDVEKARKAWGNKPCSHPNFSQETLDGIGASTGDFAYHDCGYTLYETQYFKLMEERQQEKNKK